MKNIKITYEPVKETGIIEIIRAEYFDGHCLHLWFNDGTNRIVDFEPFLKHAPNPVFKKYCDVNEFKKFTLVHGNLDWNNYEMCFPVADLYGGNL